MFAPIANPMIRIRYPTIYIPNDIVFPPLISLLVGLRRKLEQPILQTLWARENKFVKHLFSNCHSFFFSYARHPQIAQIAQRGSGRNQT